MHETSNSVVLALPAEIDSGTILALKVRVTCSAACDLRGKTVKIRAPDAVVKEMEIELTEFDGMVTETDEFVVKAPIKPGVYTWVSFFPAQEKGGMLHAASSAQFSFKVNPHATSITVWDVPSPIVINSLFKIKVGVRCSASCNLSDGLIEIYDHEGRTVANATLRSIPWPSTAALYWTDLELIAPGEAGYYKWLAKFPATELKLPHDDVSSVFQFSIASPPEHVVTVEVIDKDTKRPVKDASVNLISCGTPYIRYKKCTSDGGVAKVSVPKGEYQLSVLIRGYHEFEKTVEVFRDVTVKAEMLVSQVQD